MSRHLELMSKIVSAYVANNPVTPEAAVALMDSVHAKLVALAGEGATSVPAKEPAVPVKKSVTDEYIVCLEDGKKLKMLKRYLRTHHGMTPEDYRAKWRLPHDYPMTAPNYAAQRSQFAKKIGLGKNR